MKLSFVIPCYRSEETVGTVIGEIIQKVKEKSGADYEIIAVNDCSPDGVMEVLRTMAAENEKIKVLSLSGNVGKHAAILAGYRQVTGKYVVSVDDDGQCPMEYLWDLIQPLEEGHDMSMAQYGTKNQSAMKNLGSRVNDKMSQIILDKPQGLVFSNFIARQLFLCRSMAQYENPFPYLEGLSLKTTRDIVLVPMEERRRISGASNYTLRRSAALWLNGLTAFSVKPLRITSLLGFVTALTGFIYGIVTIVRKWLHPAISVGYSSLLVAVLFCAGMIMLLLGMIGEYVGRIYISVNHYSQYVIKEKINLD